MLETGELPEGEDEPDDGTIGPEDLGRFVVTQTCETCAGVRLRPEALAVKVGGKNIGELCRLSLKQVKAFLGGYAENDQVAGREATIALPLVRAISERLGFLIEVGLDYLTLDRAAYTLSGGEGQRIRLATQIGASLVGVLYVLDEPSIGLHACDNERLLLALRRLVVKGNSVIVVEHDRDAIMAADHVVDMGPAAGAHRRTDRRPGHSAADRGQSCQRHRALSVGEETAADPAHPHRAKLTEAARNRRARPQPARRHARSAGRSAHRRSPVSAVRARAAW